MASSSVSGFGSASIARWNRSTTSTGGLVNSSGMGPSLTRCRTSERTIRACHRRCHPDRPEAADRRHRLMRRARRLRQCKSGVMLGHIGINVPDLEVARSYYGEFLPRVGFELFLAGDDQFAFMPANAKPGTFLFFYPTRSKEPYSRHLTTGLQHLAFMVPTRSTVDDLHGWALGMENEIVHEPRTFPEYPPPYYASFWLDPFGLMLEVVCHRDSD